MSTNDTFPLPLAAFAPPYQRHTLTEQETWRLKPLFTNLDQSVYVPLIFSPEVIGALCSRTSRAPADLRPIFLAEYINPFLDEQSSSADAQHFGEELGTFIQFLHEHPIETIFSNPRARSFYNKWLAQYGDDSIAQMAGAHLVFSSLSMVAIKHFEDQRIGLAPIEKSTRYVSYAEKVNGQYRYYTDPTLREYGLEAEYRQAMDRLFDTYVNLLPRLTQWLQQQFPEEKPTVVEKKAFDTLRGLLPTSALSQVAFFGNGQSFEYLVSRSAQHRLGEIRWAAERSFEELSKVVPSFLRRLKDPERQDTVQNYQDYLVNKSHRVAPLVAEMYTRGTLSLSTPADAPTVSLVEYDADGEVKVITGMLYSAPNNQASWDEIFHAVKAMAYQERRQILDQYLGNRDQRWQKVGRAFENAYVRFEITMNIGSWTDLHRHRMLTQQRQHLSCAHGYDVPPEITAAGLETEFRQAIEHVEHVHHRIAAHDVDVAQYAVTRAHRVRFMQWENIRECFWEMELRTIPEGHPDYRHIEQAKFKLLERVYPMLAERMRVNLGEYDFARRGQEEKIQQKLRELSSTQ